MTYKTKILPAAKEDISKAAKWYNKARSGLGKQFTARVRQRVADLLDNPKVCQIRYKEVHTDCYTPVPLHDTLYG
jgi:hypothetical protein